MLEAGLALAMVEVAQRMEIVAEVIGRGTSSARVTSGRSAPEIWGPCRSHGDSCQMEDMRLLDTLRAHLQ